MSIEIGSRLYKCFHEGGHVVAAILCGATVTGVRLEPDGTGRTSLKHGDFAKKPIIACGGFAVERILFDKGMIVDGRNAPVPKTAFESQAMDTARMDKRPFYLHQDADASGQYPGAAFQPGPNWTWPPESDAPFISYALEHVVPLLRPHMSVIENLAQELNGAGRLTQEEIEDYKMLLST